MKEEEGKIAGFCLEILVVPPQTTEYRKNYFLLKHVEIKEPRGLPAGSDTDYIEWLWCWNISTVPVGQRDRSE